LKQRGASYNLWLWNSGASTWDDAHQTIFAGLRYDFDAAGVDRFRIMGIDTVANPDPANPSVFVTGVVVV
jgi:hypothetical protein